MKAEEIRSKTDDELKTQLGDLKKEAFNLRFQRAGGQLEKAAREEIVAELSKSATPPDLL